jgi:hypothetical protein
MYSFRFRVQWEGGKGLYYYFLSAGQGVLLSGRFYCVDDRPLDVGPGAGPSAARALITILGDDLLFTLNRRQSCTRLPHSGGTILQMILPRKHLGCSSLPLILR